MQHSAEATIYIIVVALAYEWNVESRTDHSVHNSIFSAVRPKKIATLEHSRILWKGIRAKRFDLSVYLTKMLRWKLAQEASC